MEQVEDTNGVIFMRWGDEVFRPLSVSGTVEMAERETHSFSNLASLFANTVAGLQRPGKVLLEVDFGLLSNFDFPLTMDNRNLTLCHGYTETEQCPW